MEDIFNKDKPDWVKEMEKRLSRKPTKAEIKAQKKADQDRDIMRALKNFINANTTDYIVHKAGSGNQNNELTYLASRGKKAGVDKEIAWESSKDFLKNRYPEYSEEIIKEGFEHHYDWTLEEPKYRRYFTKKK